MNQAIAFFDGQNLFKAAKESFGTKHPDYNPKELARYVCSKKGYTLKQIRFYTGIPEPKDNFYLNAFWRNKLNQMKRDGIYTFHRMVRYSEVEITLTTGETHVIMKGREKGIDVRIALDMVRLATEREYDIAFIFSQDQDFYEAVKDIKIIAEQQKREIKLISVFPNSPLSKNDRGIYLTDWIKITQDEYQKCIDVREYRTKAGRKISRDMVYQI